MSTEHEQDGLGWKGKTLVILVLTSWCLIFLAGILVDTAPFRKAISPSGYLKSLAGTSAPSIEAFKGSAICSWSAVFLCFTPTNLVILCIMAGFLGALGRRATLHSPPESGDDPPDLVNPYFSSLLRAFLVFLVLISGVLLVSENPFSSPSPSQYIRLGGLASLISFVVNYRPSVFSALLQRVIEVIETGKLGTGNNKSP